MIKFMKRNRKKHDKNQEKKSSDADIYAEILTKFTVENQ